MPTRAEFCIGLAANMTFADNAEKLRFLTDCQNNAESYGYVSGGTLPGTGGAGNNSGGYTTAGETGAPSLHPINQQLPTITLPGTGGDASISLPGPVQAAKLAECIASATRAFTACVATYPDQITQCQQQFSAMRDNCYGRGPAQINSYGQQTACAGCTGLDTLPACFDCWSTALGQNLQKIGVNVALIVLAILGIYIFIQREA